MPRVDHPCVVGPEAAFGQSFGEEVFSARMVCGPRMNGSKAPSPRSPPGNGWKTAGGAGTAVAAVLICVPVSEGIGEVDVEAHRRILRLASRQAGPGHLGTSADIPY